MNAKIVEMRDDGPSIKTFFLDVHLDATPGQYVMIWIRGVDEIPMSLSSPASITVKMVGDATSALFEHKKGDEIGVRGPYGRGFALKGEKILIVAGGMGVAPLIFLAEDAKEENMNVTTILGAKKKDELLFGDSFEKVGRMMISTEDGSFGHTGFVTDLMSMMDLREYDQIYTCGPEEMMSTILSECRSMGIESNLQLSIERYIKCGIGLCGTCCIDPTGLRVCRDGPVFTGDQLIDGEFGSYKRDRCGRRER
jgi:dihydroorotate dehydrogenase electron transfer subunit